MGKVWYLCKDGSFTNSDKLENAFFLWTGKRASENDKEFWMFREHCFGRSIEKTITPTVEMFLKSGRTLDAIVLYRSIHNCDLKEAKDAVEQMKSEIGD